MQFLIVLVGWGVLGTRLQARPPAHVRVRPRAMGKRLFGAGTRAGSGTAKYALGHGVLAYEANVPRRVGDASDTDPERFDGLRHRFVQPIRLSQVAPVSRRRRAPRL